MSKTKTMKEVVAFATKELKAANVRNSVVETSSIGGSVYMNVRRAFSIEGSIEVSFKFGPKKNGGLTFKPEVSTNFPACNKDVVRAAAFMGIVNELVPLAASLQVQLDEFEIVEDAS